MVLITGAGSGIGRVAVSDFAAEGAIVVVTDIDDTGAAETSALVPGSVLMPLDVRSAEQIRRTVDTILERFGQIDVLINNAMICSDEDFVELSDEAMLRELDVNLGGALRMTKAVLPAMQSQGGGVIINMSSVNGVQFFGNEVYSAAKAGLINLTQSIAVKHGRDGIRCNAVAPGTVATPYWNERAADNPEVFDRLSRFYPLGRVGQPSDVTQALLFLASDAASWITGVTLPVDGGLLAGNLMMANEIVHGGESS